MSDQLKSIAFTVAIALVCSLLLTGAATGLKERKLRNVAVDRQKNILKSVGLLAPGQPIGWEQGAGILFDDLVAALCALLWIALWVRLVG